MAGLELSTAQMVRSFQFCDGNCGEFVTEAEEKENRDAEVEIRVGDWVMLGRTIDLPSHTQGSCGKRLLVQTRVLPRRSRLGSMTIEHHRFPNGGEQATPVVCAGRVAPSLSRLATLSKSKWNATTAP